ncbi:hypothetical protein LSH36_1220g00008 [Paralvinella palmiformis]|uniref:Uncharacterized protein n=1 Tax=Paralvinella palmiformis TaxID=53620 RepID=A0AAD9ITV7_9ANNE|nr:hypothetical protein LSH36_1220g00008 [Paralvinella palmiformis]
MSEHIETAQDYVLEENPELLPELCHLQTDDVTLPKALGHDATLAKTKPEKYRPVTTTLVFPGQPFGW